MQEFYTPIQDVKAELERRWNDKELREKVRQYLGRDVPKLLQDSPKAALVRSIITPDGEFERFYKMSTNYGLDPVGLEYTSDKFVAFNDDKYGLANLSFNFGRRNDGSFRVNNKIIIDMPNAEGKQFKDIKTKWGEPLPDFHRRFLRASYPNFLNKTEDISEWLNFKSGGSRVYYEYYLALFICNGVLFEAYFTFGEESSFRENVFKPAFNKLTEFFGCKPLLVGLYDENTLEEHPWWEFESSQRGMVDNLIKTYE